MQSFKNECDNCKKYKQIVRVLEVHDKVSILVPTFTKLLVQGFFFKVKLISKEKSIKYLTVNELEICHLPKN